MNATHTPGPWKIEADPHAGGDHPNHASRFVTYGPEGFDEEGMMERGCGIVCKLMDTVEIKQNARLISAAPELLAALEMCIAVLDDPPSVIRMNDTDAFRNARAAIQKAKGLAI